MEETYQNRWKALPFVCISLLVISLDNTVLNVALPPVAEGMEATATEFQWIVDAYVSVFAALLLTMGAFGDRIGHERLAPDRADLVRQATARCPMLPLGFFRDPSFSVANLELVLGLFALFGTLFVVTQYLQTVLGFTAVQASLALFPISVLSIVGNVLSARLSNSGGIRWTIVLGMGMAAVGSFGFGLLVAGTATYLTIAPAMVLFAFGLGVLWAAATEAVMSSVPPGRAGIASVMNDTTRKLIAPLGVAVLGTTARVRYLAFIDSANLSAVPIWLQGRLREGLQCAHLAAGEVGTEVA